MASHILSALGIVCLLILAAFGAGLLLSNEAREIDRFFGALMVLAALASIALSF